MLIIEKREKYVPKALKMVDIMKIAQINKFESARCHLIENFLPFQNICGYPYLFPKIIELTS